MDLVRDDLPARQMMKRETRNHQKIGIGEHAFHFGFDVGDSDTLAALLARLRTLDSAAFAKLRQRMDERLYQLFSDAKAREAFWKLPAMRDALQLSQR